MLTEGRASEYLTVKALIAGFKASYIIADKGYDSDTFVLIITDTGVQAVIPPHSNRKEQRFYGAKLYKELSRVELFFQKAKHYRRIATRYKH